MCWTRKWLDSSAVGIVQLVAHEMGEFTVCVRCTQLFTNYLVALGLYDVLFDFFVVYVDQIGIWCIFYRTTLCYLWYAIVWPSVVYDVDRDRPKLIFINSAKTKTRPKYNDVVSAENKTEAEFNILFWPKPKPKINNAECITYVSATINKHREVQRMLTEQWWANHKSNHKSLLQRLPIFPNVYFIWSTVISMKLQLFCIQCITLSKA